MRPETELYRDCKGRIEGGMGPSVDPCLLKEPTHRDETRQHLRTDLKSTLTLFFTPEVRTGSQSVGFRPSVSEEEVTR